MFIYYKRNTSQSQVKVCRPAALNSSRVHCMKAQRICKSEILIGKPTQQLYGPLLIDLSDRQDFQRHIFDHGQELKRSGSVVTAQEPSMPAYLIQGFVESAGIMALRDLGSSSASEMPRRSASRLAASYSFYVRLICVLIMTTSWYGLLSPNKLLNLFWRQSNSCESQVRSVGTFR